MRKIKSRLGLIVFFAIFLMCFLPCSAYYDFLSPECNAYLEELKEKYSEKETVEKGFIWAVILPKNDGVETKEIQEAVYNEETGEFEAIYTFTEITIINPKGWIKVTWGVAVNLHPYDVPRIKVRYQ